MSARDLLRAVLDILDAEDEQKVKTDITIHQNDEPDDRFKQILAMLDADSFGPLANSPNEVVAPVSAVTTDAGGGMNAPKHPHDIRVKDPSAYPDQQEY
ncbi:hypothetical protein N9D61_03975 [Planktomarina sp.]|jgi:hypothetical protein|nr:hypothetical protein [Planktomarina sp.]